MLPPVGSSGGGGGGGRRPLDPKSLDRRAGQLVAEVPDRAFDNALIEMRRGDRDRDRVVGPAQLEAVLDRYKIPVGEVLEPLEKKFSDKDFDGQINYEDFMRYLMQAKEAAAAERRDEEDMEQQISDFEKRLNRRKNLAKRDPNG